MKFIVLEGIDGSGKTAVASLLANDLRKKRGKNACCLSKKSTDALTQFQSDFMKSVRHVLWERNSDEPIAEVDESSWMYLHLLWYHMIEMFILPKYASYDYAVMDGWFYKPLARNIVNRKNDVDYTQSLFKKICPGDSVFLLRAQPETCYLRKGGAKPSECGIHMNGSVQSNAASFCHYQQNVYDAYRLLSRKFPMVEIDAEPSAAQVSNSILELL
ncbi:MAG: hypothetical protein LBU32_26000 [Clostridiales bacterium]|jgi:thymidylate kinase|nr:hypothetical protein [Clostridiales bacterium]